MAKHPDPTVLLGIITAASSTTADALDAVGRLQNWLIEEKQHLTEASAGSGGSTYQATARLVEKLNWSLAETEADQATTST